MALMVVIAKGRKMFKKSDILIDEQEVRSGNLFAINVEKGRTYFSPKTENGQADMRFSTDELDDVLSWIYLGTTIRNGKKCLVVLLENPQFEVTLKGALGYINAPRVLKGVCNLFKVDEMVDIEIPSPNYMIRIFLKPTQLIQAKSAIFVYDGLSYSPESFLRGEFEPENKSVAFLNEHAYMFSGEILEILNDKYWLLPCTKYKTSENRLDFCVGACFDRMILPYYTLFSSNGYEKDGCLGIRPIAYIEYEDIDRERQEFTSYTEFVQYVIEECGVGINIHFL